jgi:hypothetical protein
MAQVGLRCVTFGDAGGLDRPLRPANVSRGEAWAQNNMPAADAGLMMPLTRSIMIFTGAPRFLYMVCAPPRLHFVSEPG